MASPRMKILIVTQWFDPEPTIKGLAFARALVDRGHHVEVLTGFPNYPGGRLYPGYRVMLRQRESMDGIRVTRVPLYPSHDGSAIKRVGNYVSFALAAAAVGAYSVQRPDVAYVYHPPATIAFPAIALKAIRGVPFVLDIQDLWPDTLAATGMVTSPSVLRAVALGCRIGYRSAARIAVLSPGFKRALIDRGVPAEKIEVIYNWCHESAITQTNAEVPILREAGVEGRFNVVFAGTMGHAQALSSVLHAAKLVAAQAPRVQFVFVGGGVEVAALKAETAAMALPNVKFLPVRPALEVAPLLSAADVLLVHLRDDPLFSITIPSKTQAYMAAGRPIVMAVRGDAADLVKEARAGVCITPEDPVALANAVCELSAFSPERLSAIGERGRAFYVRHLSRETGTARFEAVFRSVVADVGR
jgi:colanic acid biosynthesis glycosyl transferase WcaI